MAEIGNLNFYPYSDNPADNITAPFGINDHTDARLIDDRVRNLMAFSKQAFDIVHSNDVALNAELTDIGGQGWVTEMRIAADAVTESKIENGAVTTAKIANVSVDGTKIANGAINVDKLANGSVTADKIANNAINTDKIANGSITNLHIQQDAVGTTQIASNAVTNSELANNAVNTDNIVNGAVTLAKLDEDARPSIPQTVYIVGNQTYNIPTGTRAILIKASGAGGGASHHSGVGTAGNDTVITNIDLRAKGGKAGIRTQNSYTADGTYATGDTLPSIRASGIIKKNVGASGGKNSQQNANTHQRGDNGNVVEVFINANLPSSLSISIGTGGDGYSTEDNGQNGWVELTIYG